MELEHLVDNQMRVFGGCDLFGVKEGAQHLIQTVQNISTTALPSEICDYTSGDLQPRSLR